MPLGPDDLVLCAGTLPRASFRERAVAAEAGGFAGISLWLPQWSRARSEGWSDADLRAILADHGLVVAEVEAIADFGACFRGGAAAAREPTAQERLAYEVATVAGATTVTVVEWPAGAAPPLAVGPASEAFGTLCDRAASHGVAVAIEWWPGSALDVERAAAIVAGAGRPNGGLLVDTWHAHHEPRARDVLRSFPGSRVASVQVADVSGESFSGYVAATMHARRLPGDGVVDLVGWIRLLDQIGVRAPVGVEVLSDVLHRLPSREVTRRAGEALRALLRAARPPGDGGTRGSAS